MTNTLALVADGKARLIRPRKGKGSSPTEVFVQFLIPDGADDDIVTRLTFGITAAYAEAEEAIAALAEPPAPVPAPAAAAAPAAPTGKRRGKTPGVAPKLTAAAVDKALFEAGAYDEQRSITENELHALIPGAPDFKEFPKLLSGMQSPSREFLLWSENGLRGADRVKRVWLHPTEQSKRGRTVPAPAAVTHDAMALADGGAPWGGDERPAVQ